MIVDKKLRFASKDDFARAWQMREVRIDDYVKIAGIDYMVMEFDNEHNVKLTPILAGEKDLVIPVSYEVSKFRINGVSLAEIDSATEEIMKEIKPLIGQKVITAIVYSKSNNSEYETLQSVINEIIDSIVLGKVKK